MKNWILKQLRKHNTISKVKEHINYLIDGNRKAHAKTKIHSITEDVNENYKRMYLENEMYIANQKNNGGGRPPEASTTYILNLPEDLIHPTNEEWEEIYNRTIDNFCSLINENQQRKEDKGLDHVKKENRHNIAKYNSIRLNPETFKSNSVAVVHNEEDRYEKGSHVHIITSNIQNGEYLKMLNQTAGQNFIKQAYDKAVLDVLKLKPQDYIPKCDRLSEEEKEKLELEDKIQFEERMKSNPKYKTSEKGKKGGRRRRKPSKPQHIAREEEIQRKEQKADHKIEQMPKAQALIDKANAAKKDAKIELKKIKKKKLKAKKDLVEIKEQIEQNESWFVNFIKSEPIKKYIDSLRPIFAKGFNMKLYSEVSSFFSDLEMSNKKWLIKFEHPIQNGLKNKKKKKESLKKNRKKSIENVFLLVYLKKRLNLFLNWKKKLNKKNLNKKIRC
ncbi:hypothetical protein HYN70_24625 [Vibrio parahaemolyticus]|nr:hypothetical protein [Vibrio parahaemolyticus]MCF9131061.1 hypothetical protein [Vibrio parahaemolyticus]